MTDDALSRLGADSLEAVRSLRQKAREEQRAAALLDKELSRLEASWNPRSVEAFLQKSGSLAGLSETLSGPLEELIESARRFVKEEKARREETFQRRMTELVEAQGVSVRLETRDPLLLRIPPLAVEVDLDKNAAKFLFGRIVVAKSTADPEAILAHREQAVRRLEQGFDSKAFFDELHEAYLAEARRKEARPGDWVELSPVLCQLAIARQSDAFRCDPISKNFRPFGKVRFLYWLHLLKKGAGLTKDGRRLVLGAATGGSTRNKRRVFFVEDGDGNGSYHLTIRFLREGNDGG